MSDKSPLVIPAESNLEEAVKVLSAGGIVAYPTETFYGLGVVPGNVNALKRLITLKGRPRGKAIPLIAVDMDSVRELVRGGEISPLGERLIKAFWPGPLTLIFHASATVPGLIRGDGSGVGIRISDYPLCKKLLKAAGFPLTSTSANPAGLSPARDATEVQAQAQKYFNGQIDLIIDGGAAPGGIASTLVDVREEKPIILREGVIKTLDILKAAG